MNIGPVQMLILGFEDPKFTGEGLAELERLREAEIIRLIDLLAVWKDADGNVAVLQDTQLSEGEAKEFGAVVGGLIGLGMAGEEGLEAAPRPASRRSRISTCSTPTSLVRRGHDPEQHRRGDRADRASVGDPPQGHDRQRRRLRARGRVDPREGPRLRRVEAAEGPRGLVAASPGTRSAGAAHGRVAPA